MYAIREIISEPIYESIPAVPQQQHNLYEESSFTTIHSQDAMERTKWTKMEKMAIETAVEEADQFVINNNIEHLQIQLARISREKRDLRARLKIELQKSRNHSAIFWRKNFCFCL